MMFLQRLVLLTVLFGSCQAAWNVTCDFDLDNIEEIIQYLPIECQEIYKSGSTSELFKASLEESSKFEEFYNKLEAYERKEGSTPVGEVPKQNTTLRFDIYNSTMLCDCANVTDSLSDEVKTKEYFNCLTTKREQMINLIPN